MTDSDVCIVHWNHWITTGKGHETGWLYILYKLLVRGL